MTDLNFFLPYTNSTKRSKNANVFMYLLVGIILIYVIGSTAMFFLNSILLNKEIRNLKANITDKTFQEKYKNSGTTIKKYDLINKYDVGARASYTSILSKKVVSGELIKSLFSTLPQDMSISSMTINEGLVQLQCTAANRVSVAEFEHNLLKLNNISAVDINAISTDSVKGKYSFSAKCTLKGVGVK
ncbi:PilN domain-containing protein [Clostridium frigoris]|uniref:PilN domain-containing protein n=1 Tax=Clostridium frigoris TaxID=205327 RepID=A0ABS6BUE0_9CLOT|nr:PilN domain-containing protein [Clostridium frigoris]MBU3160432.1 PilN domain-containing protein [Clostridium frigoris]